MAGGCLLSAAMHAAAATATDSLLLSASICPSASTWLERSGASYPVAPRLNHPPTSRHARTFASCITPSPPRAGRAARERELGDPFVATTPTPSESSAPPRVYRRPIGWRVPLRPVSRSAPAPPLTEESPCVSLRSARQVGATGLEPATFRPPADEFLASTRPGASPASPSFPAADGLDASDVAIGTKVVPRQECREGIALHGKR